MLYYYSDRSPKQYDVNSVTLKCQAENPVFLHKNYLNVTIVWKTTDDDFFLWQMKTIPPGDRLTTSLSYLIAYNRRHLNKFINFFSVPNVRVIHVRRTEKMYNCILLWVSYLGIRMYLYKQLRSSGLPQYFFRGGYIINNIGKLEIEIKKKKTSRQNGPELLARRMRNTQGFSANIVVRYC